MQIVKGKVTRGWFSVLYGPPGVGKTTLASQAPDPLFLDLEHGSDLLDVARIKPDANDRLADVFRFLFEARGQFQTIVIDSLTSYDRRAVAELCTAKAWETLESAGFGNGIKIYRQKFREQFLGTVDRFRDAGKNVILVAHAKTRTVDDPTLGQSFQRLEFDCDGEVNQYILAHADGCFLLRQKFAISEGKVNHAVGSGTRILLTKDKPSYLAKTRFSIDEKIESPNSEFWISLNN